MKQPLPVSRSSLFEAIAMAVKRSEVGTGIDARPDCVDPCRVIWPFRAETCSKVDLSTMIGLRTKSSRVGLSDGLAFFAVPGLT